jgi:hypothetical protein
VPRPTIVEISLEEQERMRAELRRARYGYLLALHLLLLCAAGRTPSEVASVLFCSRSSVYRIVRAYRAGTLTFDEGSLRATIPVKVRLITAAAPESVRSIRAFAVCHSACEVLASSARVWTWCISAYRAAEPSRRGQW